jgi:hypothetical protein
LNSAKIARLNLRHERMFAILPFRSEGQWSAQQAFIFDWRRSVPTFDLDDRSWRSGVSRIPPLPKQPPRAKRRRSFDGCALEQLPDPSLFSDDEVLSDAIAMLKMLRDQHGWLLGELHRAVYPEDSSVSKPHRPRRPGTGCFCTSGTY